MYLFSDLDWFECYCCKDEECDEEGGELKETHEQVTLDERWLH